MNTVRVAEVGPKEIVVWEMHELTYLVYELFHELATSPPEKRSVAHFRETGNLGQYVTEVSRDPSDQKSIVDAAVDFVVLNPFQ